MINIPGQFDFTPQGWICPKCKAVMSPTFPTCFYCKPQNEIKCTTTTFNNEWNK